MTLTLIGYALYDSINYLSLSWPTLCFFLSFLHADSNKKTLGCKQLKILMKLNYTKQVSFYCFHFELLKKMKTEKRLTLLTLCHAFLPLKNGRANIDTDGVYCLIPALRFDTTGPKIAHKIVQKINQWIIK